MGTINNFGCNIIGSQTINNAPTIKWMVKNCGKTVYAGNARTEAEAKTSANDLLNAVNAREKGAMYSAHVYIWPIESVKSAATKWQWKAKP